MAARVDGADTIGVYMVVAGKRLRPANAVRAVAGRSLPNSPARSGKAAVWQLGRRMSDER